MKLPKARLKLNFNLLLTFTVIQGWFFKIGNLDSFSDVNFLSMSFGTNKY